MCKPENKCPFLLADTAPCHRGAGLVNSLTYRPQQPDHRKTCQRSPPQENKASPSFGLSGGWGGNTEQKEEGVRGQGCPEKVVGLSLPPDQPYPRPALAELDRRTEKEGSRKG